MLHTVFTRVSIRSDLFGVLEEQRLFEGGTLSREALIKYIKKTLKYFELVSLIKQ